MKTLNKICHNSDDHHQCTTCGVDCCDVNCDQSQCEIITDLNGHKKMTCLCPGTRCICLNREPTKKEFSEHLVNVYFSNYKI